MPRSALAHTPGSSEPGATASASAISLRHATLASLHSPPFTIHQCHASSAYPPNAIHSMQSTHRPLAASKPPAVPACRGPGACVRAPDRFTRKLVPRACLPQQVRGSGSRLGAGSIRARALAVGSAANRRASQPCRRREPSEATHMYRVRACRSQKFPTLNGPLSYTRTARSRKMQAGSLQCVRCEEAKIFSGTLSLSRSCLCHRAKPTGPGTWHIEDPRIREIARRFLHCHENSLYVHSEGSG